MLLVISSGGMDRRDAPRSLSRLSLDFDVFPGRRELLGRDEADEGRFDLLVLPVPVLFLVSGVRIFATRSL